MSRQARFFLLTVPQHHFLPYLPDGVQHIAGQLELAPSGFCHWQIVVSFPKKVSLVAVRRIFGAVHAEATRSEAARAYCFKEDTRVQGTQFELGTLAIRRSSATDWNLVRASAQSGDLDSIPADIYVRCYHQLRRISADHVRPLAIVRSCEVFWGRTNSGKSQRAWAEGGLLAYGKDPRTKWWDGYLGEEHVIIDEFRGTIDVTHLLRWLDRYPVRVECKGSSLPLSATKFWITSNLDPRDWYPDLDSETLSALMRRLNITHFLYPLSYYI